MKINNILISFSAAMILFASCQKTVVNEVKEDGYLSFSELSISVDETVDTKAEEAGGDYVITVLNSEGTSVLEKRYSEVISNDNKISLPAGNYTLNVKSSSGEIPTHTFNNTPFYGVTKDFDIVAGEVTTVGDLVCTLLQCMVSVSYSDEFLAAVTGPGSTKVTLKSGCSLEYVLNADGTYEKRTGYFAVEGTTMEVVFKGEIEGKTQKMTKTFAGIAPKQWRQIKFVPKTNEQGTATFDIIINDLISDETLSNQFAAEEEILAPDPEAPEDDGGIKLMLAPDCDPTITYDETDIVYDSDGVQINSVGLINIPIEPLASDGSVSMNIKFVAVIPEGLAELTVDISTDSDGFMGAVQTANASHIDLVNPVCDPLIFDVVPFPHGSSILGLKEIEFDLSSAQVPILAFEGNHVFTMTVVDVNGKTKVNKVTMVVE